jgi:glycosyltransferase involved in cell wall biosynthesis
MPEVTVSILMPVYNGEQYLSEAIESALAQTYKNFELLVVNDGSTDNSVDVIRPFLKDSRVIYIQQKNAGVAAARNTAIKQATGKYLGFLDQDDIWLNNKLEVQVAALEQDENIALVYSNQDFIDAYSNKIDYDWITGGASGYCFGALFKKNWISVLTVLIRKTVIDEIGPFNEQLPGTDDYEIWLRVTLKYPIRFIDQSLALYRFHDNNVSKNRFKMTVLFLKAINTILSEHPEALNIAGKQTVRARLHELHSQLGDWYSWYDQDFIQGRKHYWLAILNNPFVLRPYYRFVYCLLSKKQRKALNWYSSKLKNVLS